MTDPQGPDQDSRPLAAAGASAVQGAGAPIPRSRQLLLYLAGSFISWTGDWMDLAALNWAVLEYTGSGFYLGVVNACRLVPLFALSLPAGVLADRFDRRRLLAGLQGAMMVMTFMVGGLVAARAPFWLFTAVVTARAVLGAMALPVRTALIANLVPPRALPRAVAAQSAVMNVARTSGLAGAAALLVVLPLEGVFWVNGASFALVLLSLLLLRPSYDDRTDEAASTDRPFAEAFAYVRDHPTVQSLLVLAVVPMVFGFPYQTLMPLFARDLLGADEPGYATLLALAAAGSLLASAWLSLAGPVRRAGRWLVLSVVGFGLALILFTASGQFAVAAGLAFAVGLVSQFYRTLSRVTMQVHVPDRLRGRILSIALMDRGFIPLGAVLIGVVADRAGTYAAGLAMGGGCIAATLLTLLVRPRLWGLELPAPRPETAA